MKADVLKTNWQFLSAIVAIAIAWGTLKTDVTYLKLAQADNKRAQADHKHTGTSERLATVEAEKRNLEKGQDEIKDAIKALTKALQERR